MAGAGYRLFNTGDVLTAAQVNNYLQEQVIMVFANSSARTSALSGVLAEGMASYLQDTNSFEIYNGSAWVSASGDLTGLTAGTGITITDPTGPVPTITNDVATEFDTKGDLIVGTGADTFDKLVAGSNGETLVADSAATTGLRWQGNYAAGKNKIINGDFNIWQRGTSFSVTSAAVIFTSDRWSSYNNGNGTITVSRQAFTAGSAPVAGYESEYFARINVASAGTSTDWLFRQPIEDVRTLANQTATVSFYAKASASQTLKAQLQQVFGSGGSGTVSTTVINSQTLTASWVRYSASVSLPSISGKTIGAGNHLLLQFSVGTGGIATGDIDIWGVQVEAGSVATAFQTATGTLQGELAACERYYFRSTGALKYLGSGGIAGSTTECYVQVKHPTTMRVAPTSLDYSLLLLQIITNSFNVTAAAISSANPLLTLIKADVASGLTATTQSYMLMTQNNATAYIGLSAEL